MNKKTIISISIFCLLIIISLLILLVKNFSFGYAYYNQDDLISIESSENLQQKIEDITQAFNEQGFGVIYNSFSNISCKKVITHKKNIVNEKSALDAYLEKEMSIAVSLKKLQISKEDLIYYFKSGEECNDFIKAINISDYVVEDYIGSCQLVTSEKELKDTIEKKREKEQEKKRNTITSRDGSKRLKINPPMESYVYISSYYGNRNGKMHTGVDFAAPAGTSIYAWKSGIVTFAGWKGRYGNFIIIEHEDGSVSRYAHCKELLVEEGQSVNKNDTIAYVGSTGNSTGNHLHFEILIDDEFINPLTPITI
jgi:hypothetical protein